MLRRYVIEREINGVGTMDNSQLGDATKQSNAALAEILGIQWQHSYVTRDKTFCIYLAESEDQIRIHARRSGFPANVITEVSQIIDPTTERYCTLAVTEA